jgi:hypothetical protein
LKLFNNFFLRLKDQDVKETMLRRSIDLLKMWIDGFYVIDFQQNDQLYKLFEHFIDKEVAILILKKKIIIFDLY